MDMRRVVRAYGTGTLSLSLGIASVLLSFWLFAFFVVAFALFWFTDFTAHTGQPWDAFIRIVTQPPFVTSYMAWLTLPSLTGGVGLWLARRPRMRSEARVSLGRSASRFCIAGLTGSLCAGSVMACMFAYQIVRG